MNAPAPIAPAPLAIAPSGFDKLARSYRWMERLTFGNALTRCREHFLPRLLHARQALVLGDGDGRFTAALLRTAPHLLVQAVDASAAMLLQLQSRALAAGAHSRLRVHHADATATLPDIPCDLVCTHFFLDCLSTPQTLALAAAVRLRLQPGGVWVISEFAIPHGLARWPATLLVHSLYVAFRILTGLRTRSLPDHATALRSNGFTLIDEHPRLAGLLRSELWQRSI